MADEGVIISPAQGTEAAATTESEAPKDFREYAKWRATGELPEAKEESQSAAVVEKPPAKTDSDSETDGTQDAEDNEETDNDEDAPAGKTKGGSRQRRIDRLTRENEELKRQIAGHPVKSDDKPSEPAAKPATAAGKPKLEDFQTLEAYQEALTDWKLDERDRLQREQQARTAAEEANRAEQSDWSKKEKAARKAHSDYDELMETVEIPAGPGVLAARKAMLEDPNGAELLYHLAKNPKELERIAALSPASAIMAIGKLSATLEKPAALDNGKPKLTGAPKPPPPNHRPGKIVSDDPNDPDVQKDFKRWAKAREAQLKGR